MPMNEDGTLKEVQVDGKKYKGKALYDILEHNVRRAFVSRDPKKREQGRNTLWYLWTAPNSPLYGRDKMTTFERYFLAEKETWTEVKNDVLPPDRERGDGGPDLTGVRACR